MEDEAVHGVSIPLTMVMEGVGIWKSTATQIKKEEAQMENRNTKKISKPNKKSKVVCPRIEMDDSYVDFYRRHINNYHKINNAHPTLNNAEIDNPIPVVPLVLFVFSQYVFYPFILVFNSGV